MDETRHKGEGVEKLLGIPGKLLDGVFKVKDDFNSFSEWFQGLIEYSAQVEAYAQADEVFKKILERMMDYLPEDPPEEQGFKSKLEKALESWVQYNSSDSIREQCFMYYLEESGKAAVIDFINKNINKCVVEWLKALFPEVAVISEVAGAVWKVLDYVTQNGKLVECQKMLQANAYFEQAVFNTLCSIEGEFRGSPTRDNARLFDVAYKFLKETELHSMDICITFCNTYQTSWAQAIMHASNTFMNSFIDEVHRHKLYLSRAYCHGISYNLGGKVITIACPTNVYLYDESGAVVAVIEDDIVKECGDNVLAYTADAVKMFIVPLDQEYTVNVIATDGGNMSYIVSEYDADMNNVQTIVYSNVKIERDDRFSGKISKELNASPESYKLTGGSGLTADSYEVVTGEDNVPVERVEIVTEVETIRVGDVISLETKIIPDTAVVRSLVWSSSDDKVADVSEDGVVTAKAAGAATITAQSVFGGVNTEILIEVVGESDNSGFGISGTIQSFGSDQDPVTVRLLQGTNEVSRQESVNGTYTLKNIAAGNYMLEAGKANHVAREYTLDIIDQDVTLDVEIHLTGDVTGDGKVNAADKLSIYKSIEGGVPLSGYDLLVGDVTGDGSVNMADKLGVYKHIEGSKPLWE